ncbi:MAG: DNA repair protein RecN [Eubacteriales bacterium]|nr:DNA repair protein RecN [Eubacteriales bacterium]
MITHISIHNFAIIKNTELDLSDGLNIITGETGSGKSIVIEAISLALGGRADSSYVRHGCEKAVIQMLAETDEEEISISREISAIGKNICRINGNLATRTELAHEMEKIADIHGQYDNVKLLNPDTHISLVDEYKCNRILPAKEAFTDAYENYKSARNEYRALLQQEQNTKKNADYLKYELEEIRKVSPKPGEDQDLENQISILKNSEEIFKAFSGASSDIDGSEDSALTRIGNALRCLDSAENISTETKKIKSQMESIYYDLTDLSEQIRSILDRIHYAPNEVDLAISRAEQIEQLKNKHNGSIEGILSDEKKFSIQLESLETYEADRKKLELNAKSTLASLKLKANELSEIRKANASELSEAIEKELRDLNFPDARFSIDVKTAKAIGPNGQDTCEIQVGLNQGEPMKPLSKTASGGEISRIMLAIKNVTGSYDQIPTMIFDEIDTGISGKTADIVAKKLKEISEKHQVLCITHLPQIAAAADHGYRIFKETKNNETFAHIESLDESAEIEEIARLLSGDHITEVSRQNAKELYSRFR